MPNYKEYEKPYTGTVYEIITPKEKMRLICPDLWA